MMTLSSGLPEGDNIKFSVERRIYRGVAVTVVDVELSTVYLPRMMVAGATVAFWAMGTG